jgi:DNA-binding transcriptional MerR regulator
MRQAEVCAIAGITYRQLDHWISKGIIGLSVDASRRGSGPPYRTFTDDDVSIIVRIADEKREIDNRINRWMTDNFIQRLDGRSAG